MKTGKIRNAPWYSLAVAICIGVLLYFFLADFSNIRAGINTFFGYFSPVILGCIIAYIVNPLAGLFSRLFSRIKKDGTRRLLSNALAFFVVVLFIFFTGLILVPQLIDSISTFVGNLDGYIATVNHMLENLGVTKSMFDLSSIIDSTENLLGTISTYIKENSKTVLDTSVNVGMVVFRWVIAFILSIYLLTEKPRLKSGVHRLLKALFGEERYEEVHIFLRKCDKICNRYIVYNLIDSLIIGGVNAVFMTICGMQYVGLISFVAAVTNLIPTFGPMIGAVIAVFILLMVNPTHALIFLIFTLVLQTCDAYVIKPKLFGNSLGVSGLLIMVGVIAGGNMFGVIGILLAVPAVAIIDFAYSTMFLPWLEKKHGVNSGEAGNESLSLKSGNDAVGDNGGKKNDPA
ncbi:MAG: AI-2E family transporter [Clostridia bacterium]|nr:AI-2E family transporter [Clostridia bacterium]